MSRMPIKRDLPPLSTIYPEFSGFRKKTNKRAALEEAMRKVLLAVRKEERTNFYSMREISLFFKVSLKSVSIVFERLNKEGLLTIVRGSHTVLEGAHKSPRVKLRGVVGVPVSLPSFVFGSNPRTFFICLENELQKHGYVVDFIFYSSQELENEHSTRRLLNRELDIVFWNAPKKAAGEIMLQLKDTGVRVVAVGDFPKMFPVQQYVLDPWVPYFQTSVDYYYEGIQDSLLRAASHLPRVDTIGGIPGIAGCNVRLTSARPPQKLEEEGIVGHSLRRDNNLRVFFGGD